MYGPHSYVDLTWERSANYSARTFLSPMGPGKREHIDVDKLLPTQMLPSLPTRATFVFGTQKMFLILFRNILCPQQHSFGVPRVCAPKKHHEQQCVRNNVFSFARVLSPHRPLSHKYLRIPRTPNNISFAYPKKQTHTICNCRPHTVDPI